MEIGQSIYKIRNNAKLTQEQFAEMFGVSQQAVQKWESGGAVPDIEKIVKIAKYFDISLDSLVMGNDNRLVEDMNKSEILKPQYKNIHDWEFYSSNLQTEYQQSVEERKEGWLAVYSSEQRISRYCLRHRRRHDQGQSEMCAVQASEILPVRVSRHLCLDKRR